jgi:hypothetical protein
VIRPNTETEMQRSRGRTGTHLQHFVAAADLRLVLAPRGAHFSHNVIDVLGRRRRLPPNRAPPSAILYEKGIKLKLSDNEVHYTACYLLVILKYSSGKFHCLKVIM